MDVAATTHECEERADWQKIIDNLRDDEKTATVRLLLQIVAAQAQRISDLKAEIARLKGENKKPKSNSKPSGLNQPPADNNSGRGGGLRRSGRREHGFGVR